MLIGTPTWPQATCHPARSDSVACTEQDSPSTRLEGLFADDAVVFKGGTAIRKFVLGNEGGSSTVLDLAVEDPVYADHVLERLGQRVAPEGVAFVLGRHDAAARKWHLARGDGGARLIAARTPRHLPALAG